MTRTALQVVADALDRPADERARLARILIDSLEADCEKQASAAEIEAAWRAQVERRERELEGDTSLLRSADQVFAEAERHLEKIRSSRESRSRQA